MSRYLGNNFWLVKDKVLHTITGMLIPLKDLPPTMIWKESSGKYKVEERTDFYLMKEGMKFVIFDFCERLRTHKKTNYACFTKFETINNGWRKYDGIKANNGFFHFKYNFLPNKVYKLLVEINHKFPDSIKILKWREI